MRSRSCVPAILLSAMILLLSACATTRNYERYLDNWVGKDAGGIVQKWGEPDRINTFADGRKCYEYRFSDRHFDAERAPAGRGRTGPGANVGCITYFFIDPQSNRVLSWKWEGHDCVKR